MKMRKLLLAVSFAITSMITSSTVFAVDGVGITSTGYSMEHQIDHTVRPTIINRFSVIQESSESTQSVCGSCHISKEFGSGYSTSSSSGLKSDTFRIRYTNYNLNRSIVRTNL